MKIVMELKKKDVFLYFDIYETYSMHLVYLSNILLSENV